MKKRTILLLFAILVTSIVFSQSNFQSEGAIKSKEIKELLKNQINNQAENFNYPQNENVDPLKSVKFDYGDPPVWNWVNQFGGSGKDLASDIVTDDAGNIYITGHFSGEISIGSNTYSSVGNWDGFVAKFTQEGSLIWFKQLSPDSDDLIKVYGINLDGNDNIYVTGYYTGTITLGGINLPDIIPENLFFAKLDASGDITMAKNHGITNYLETGKVIDIDNDGNIYVVGLKDGYMNYYARSVILKYDASGNLLIEIEQDENFWDMVIYGQNIYFLGTINDDGYIGNIYLDPVSYGDVFLAKSDLFITFEWAVMAEHQNSGDSYGKGLYVSEDENIYVTGGYRSDIILGGSQISNINSGFIAKCTPEGDFIWVNQLTNEPHTQFYPYSISGNNNEVFASYRYANNSPTYYPELSSYSTDNGEAIHMKSLEHNVEDVHYSTALDDVICSIDNNENISISDYTPDLMDQWNIDFGGNSAKTWVLGMDADQDENFIVYGYASNPIDFFGMQIDKGLFLAKISSGGILYWIRPFPDAYLDKSAGKYVTINENTNSVFITGTFYEPFQIPGEITLEPDPDGSIFLVKYNLQGVFQWAIQEDFNSWQLCLAADNAGNVLLSGTFYETIDIGNTTLTSSGLEDVFVSKYNQAGQFQWAIRAGGESDEYIGLISCDAQNYIYLTGEFTSTDVTIKDFSITLNEGDGNILLAKIEPEGDPNWVKSKAGSLTYYGDYYGWPSSIKADAEGNTYIKGQCADSVYFDDIMLTSLFTPPVSNNHWNTFITKFDTDGNTLWANSINLRSWGWDYTQMDIDDDGNVYFGSQVKDTTIFGEYFTYLNSGLADLYVAKYTNDGDLDWVKAMESEGSFCYLNSVAVNDVNSVFVAGSFRDYLNFGDTPLRANNENGFATLFGDFVGIKVYERNDTDLLFSLYPNPAQNSTNILLNDISLSDIMISISDIAGRIIYEGEYQNYQEKIEINISDFSKGVYLVKVKSGAQSDVKKLVVD